MTNPKESVLLVDDEEAIRAILNKGLALRGFECEEAESGEQALERLERRPTELVIMDINMPGRPGSEILPVITERFPDTAVIMASGISEPKVIAECIQSGAQDYLTKPFRFEQVLQSVNGALDKRRVAVDIRHYFAELEKDAENDGTEPRKVFQGAIIDLINTLEAYDSYTSGHTQKVTELCLAIGTQMAFTPEQLEDLRWAALLHDVGKIAVDPDILNKPGELTSTEYRHIMTHAIVGPSLVKPFVNGRVIDIISHHHDHYDGTGFGQSSRGRAIPVGARIISVVDAYQAMISDRPYRKAMSALDAIEEITWNAGSQFDPIVANTLIRLVQQRGFREAALRFAKR
jgi:response regulator RpfG family c-di-GMP phosphodiesterase